MNFSASAGVNPDMIALRGAAVCALVQALTIAGRRTEVRTVHAVSDHGNDHYETQIKIKAVEADVQVDMLAFTIMHASMLPRLHFSFGECGKIPCYTRRSSYGSPTAATFEADIMLGPAKWSDGAWSSVESAKAWVLARLREQGVRLTESVAA